MTRNVMLSFLQNLTGTQFTSKSNKKKHKCDIGDDVVTNRPIVIEKCSNKDSFVCQIKDAKLVKSDSNGRHLVLRKAR